VQSSDAGGVPTEQDQGGACRGTKRTPARRRSGRAERSAVGAIPLCAQELVGTQIDAASVVVSRCARMLSLITDQATFSLVDADNLVKPRTSNPNQARATSFGRQAGPGSRIETPSH
jgi:hypothetical protein